MAIFLCEFAEWEYKEFLDIKKLLREHGVEFEVQKAVDGARGEVQRIWLPAPSREAMSRVEMYLRKRHRFRALRRGAAAAYERLKASLR